MAAKVRPRESKLIHFDGDARPHGVLPNQNRNIKVILRNKDEIRSITARSNSSHLDAYSGPIYTGQHVLGQPHLPFIEPIREIL